MSWLDKLPSTEQQKIRKRMRSPEAYERLRERVKGPEDLEREMEKNSEFAELKFDLETEPKLKDELKELIESEIKSNGIEGLLQVEELSDDELDAISRGDFDIKMESNDENDYEQIVIVIAEDSINHIPLDISFLSKLKKK
ncbi:hypothetical protein HN960_00605 [Candidatus Peregrinibacteria bacterium]|nr:hypothetical protein [Candidatus Peregrinibacteria bacterium]MBT7008923.1 hypothetical protein [Candidatus Peregrinibacteria bacterium]